VNKSENLEPVESDTFLQEEQVWDCADGIKPKVKLEVVKSNLLNIFVCHSSFDKAKKDLNSVNDIDNTFNVHQCLLAIL